MRKTKGWLQFSVNQKHALDVRRNLAVRANAGSGKTSVLIERLVQLLAHHWDQGDESLKLNELVAVTFTRKAAGELQERLCEAFEEMAKNAADFAERTYWSKLAADMPRAFIGTIDSLCGRILREFGLHDESPDRIEPDYQILEDYDEILLKREAVDRLINRLSSAEPDSADAVEQSQIEACRWWGATQGYEVLTRHLTRLLGHVVESEKIAAAHRDLPPAAERVRAAWSAVPAVQRLNRERPDLILALESLVSRIDSGKKPGKTLTDLRDRILAVLDCLRTPDQDAQALKLLELRSPYAGRYAAA